MRPLLRVPKLLSWGIARGVPSFRLARLTQIQVKWIESCGLTARRSVATTGE